MATKPSKSRKLALKHAEVAVLLDVTMQCLAKISKLLSVQVSVVMKPSPVDVTIPWPVGPNKKAKAG